MSFSRSGSPSFTVRPVVVCRDSTKAVPERTPDSSTAWRTSAVMSISSVS